MSKLNGKEITYAVLAGGPIHTPQTGQLGPVLTNTPSAVNKAVKMTEVGSFVYVEVPGLRGAKSTMIKVPTVHFTHLVEKEDVAQDSKA